MDAVVRSKQKIVSKTYHQYPKFNWTLNLDNQVFSYDFDAFNFLFAPTDKINSMTGFLSIMTAEQRKEAKAAIKEVIATHNSRKLSCCIMPNN